jgi:hypothetical protein
VAFKLPEKSLDESDFIASSANDHNEEADTQGPAKTKVMFSSFSYEAKTLKEAEMRLNARVHATQFIISTRPLNETTKVKLGHLVITITSACTET